MRPAGNRTDVRFRSQMEKFVHLSFATSSSHLFVFSRHLIVSDADVASMRGTTTSVNNMFMHLTSVVTQTLSAAE